MTILVVTKGTSEYNRQFFLKLLESSSAKVVTKVTSEYSSKVMKEPEVLKIIPAMKQYLKLVLPEITEIHLRKKY